MFEYFIKAKRFEIAALTRLKSLGRMPEALSGERAGFSQALKKKAASDGLALIAEYKRASPSQGDIALEVTPGRAAAGYVRAGAAAMSVLTEKSKFKGRLGFLNDAAKALGEGAGLPLLRKDFIFHPLQVEATAAVPASALLLIVRLTPSAEVLKSLRLKAESYGLECVVEVLDEADLSLARQSGARVIQVNARDFTDLSVDLNRSLRLADKSRLDDEIWVAASGVNQSDDLKKIQAAGFTAALVGTALMRGSDPAGALSRLINGFKNPRVCG